MSEGTLYTFILQIGELYQVVVPFSRGQMSILPNKTFHFVDAQL